MANRNQLSILTSGQAAEIAAIGSGLAVIEVVRVYWPSPDGTKNYVFWDPREDPVYAASDFETWLDGNPLIVAFDPGERGLQPFHEIPRTSAIGDDVVRMRFANLDRNFEELAYKHRGGVRVEIFHFLPQLNGGAGLAVSWFLGHLKTSDNAATDWVEIDVAAGFRSPDLLVPSRNNSDQCGVLWGGDLNAVQIIGNPCPYDLHLPGGTIGNNDPTTGNPFTFCDFTKSACIARLGGHGATPLSFYGGHDSAVDSTQIGAGDHKTTSTTAGSSTDAVVPKRVIYGRRKVRSLRLLDFAKEFNPSSDHQDKGTIRLLYEIGEGPNQSVDDVKVNGTELPRPDGLGLEVRLGTRGQAATGFSPSVLNYSHTAHIRGDLNPIDPRGQQPKNFDTECIVEGRNTVRIYSDEDSFTEDYTNNRSWCLFDLIRNPWYGLREDPARHEIDDFIYLAGKNSSFNADVQGTRTAQQQITDICSSARWFLPFVHNGKTRWLAQETYDLEDADIPLFTDTGPNRNILKDGRDVPRISVSYRDDDEIPNELILLVEDEDKSFLERPFRYPDTEQQRRAGQKYGDNSLRKVEDRQVAFGITNTAEAHDLGFSLLDFGPFLNGGIRNNLTVVMVVPRFIPEAIDLHENKVIEIDSSILDIYEDLNGNPFTHFIVKSLTQTRDGELIVVAQAYGSSPDRTVCEDVIWTNLTLTTDEGGGTLARGTDGQPSNCFEDASGTGTAGGKSVQVITGGNWSLKFNFGSDPEGRCFAGVTNNNLFTNQFAQMWYCWHVSDQNNTIQSLSPHSMVIYELGFSQQLFDGEYTFGDELEIRCVNNVVTYWHNGVLKGTSALAPQYPLFVAGSIACHEKTINDAHLCHQAGGNPSEPGGGGEGGGGETTQDPADSAAVLVDRLIDDPQLFAGILGFNFGAAPTSQSGAWAGASLYVDRGSGFVKLAEVDTAAVLGEAATALAGTTGGSETVQVEIQPGQVLPTAGRVYLGGEIFDYGAAAQDDDDPNLWTLSSLTNRGTRCTNGAIGTHAIGEDFLLLNSAVVFVPMAAADIEQTYDYKIVTEGQLAGPVPDFPFLLDAPNFDVTTPADYLATFDPLTNQIVHTWTPISNPCLVSTSLIYQIYADSAGSPGALLWQGVASEWREPVSSSGTRAYHFRAKTNYKNGNYETDSETFVVTTPGAGGGSAIVWVIDGGGAAITPGHKGYLEIPFDCEIDRWTLMADIVGSIVIDIWKDEYFNFPPLVADSITASAKPTLADEQDAQDDALTGWTTAIDAGDILAFNVDTASAVTRVTLSLKVTKT
jgi:hypothetical protein